jgi:hypothetical protein
LVTSLGRFRRHEVLAGGVEGAACFASASSMMTSSAPNSSSCSTVSMTSGIGLR